MYTTNTTKAKDQKHGPLCLHILLCMNTSVKRTFSVFVIAYLSHALYPTSWSRKKDLVCGRTMNVLGPHSVATYMNLFRRAAPFIVLSSSFTQRSLYEAQTKGWGLGQALARIGRGVRFVYLSVRA